MLVGLHLSVTSEKAQAHGAASTANQGANYLVAGAVDPRLLQCCHTERCETSNLPRGMSRQSGATAMQISPAMVFWQVPESWHLVHM